MRRGPTSERGQPSSDNAQGPPEEGPAEDQATTKQLDEEILQLLTSNYVGYLIGPDGLHPSSLHDPVLVAYLYDRVLELHERGLSQAEIHRQLADHRLSIGAIHEWLIKGKPGKFGRPRTRGDRR